VGVGEILPPIFMVQEINDRLIKVHGRDYAGRPLYRLVFSDTQLEKRSGVFADYYGPIFLREFVGVREVKKYEQIAKGCWILEKLILGNQPELLVNFSYEPIWVFRDKLGKPVQPYWWSIEMILHQLLFGERTTPQSAQAEDEKKERDYINYVESMCDTTVTESLLQTGQGIAVPSNYRSQKEV
jgi:hypothetical protein